MNQSAAAMLIQATAVGFYSKFSYFPLPRQIKSIFFFVAQRKNLPLLF